MLLSPKLYMRVYRNVNEKFSLFFGKNLQQKLRLVAAPRSRNTRSELRYKSLQKVTKVNVVYM